MVEINPAGRGFNVTTGMIWPRLQCRPWSKAGSTVKIDKAAARFRPWSIRTQLLFRQWSLPRSKSMPRRIYHGPRCDFDHGRYDRWSKCRPSVDLAADSISTMVYGNRKPWPDRLWSKLAVFISTMIDPTDGQNKCGHGFNGWINRRN